jgi:hypothetical protein
MVGTAQRMNKGGTVFLLLSTNKERRERVAFLGTLATGYSIKGGSQFDLQLGDELVVLA